MRALLLVLFSAGSLQVHQRPPIAIAPARGSRGSEAAEEPKPKAAGEHFRAWDEKSRGHGARKREGELISVLLLPRGRSAHPSIKKTTAFGMAGRPKQES